MASDVQDDRSMMDGESICVPRRASFSSDQELNLDFGEQRQQSMNHTFSIMNTSEMSNQTEERFALKTRDVNRSIDERDEEEYDSEESSEEDYRAGLFTQPINTDTEGEQLV